LKRTMAFFMALLCLIMCSCSVKGPASPRPAATQTPTATPSPSPVQTVTGALAFYENSKYLQKSGDEGLICRAEFPTLTLDSAHAAAFPELSAAIDALNADFAVEGNAAYERLLRIAESDIELNTETSFPYTRTFRLSMPRADDRAVSVLCSMTEYSGGPQSAESFFAYNFDSKTGRALSIENVVGDTARLPELLEAALTAEYPKAEFYSLPDSLQQYIAGEKAAYTWTMDYQGLSFYFAPYELAPYEEGSFTVSLRFDDHPEFFSLYYTPSPYSFSIPLIGGECLNYDMDGNGRADEISVKGIYDKSGEFISTLSISVNGKISTANVNILDFEAYVVYTGPGKNFLVINAFNKGYGYISAYRLEKSGASLTGMLYDTSLQAAGYSGKYFGKPVLTCPSFFPLGTRIELLSTMTGLKTYRIGESGLPETADDFYDLSAPSSLVAISEFSTATLDQGTGMGNFSTVKIVPGTALYFWRSDGAGLVDMYTDKGDLCRFYVSGKKPAQNVNGMPADGCFEGMVYTD